jgi:ABC-type transport system involved in multi-copper enzyme maturation permease subunit
MEITVVRKLEARSFIVFLLAILVVCFSISYVVFMRREIRSL